MDTGFDRFSKAVARGLSLRDAMRWLGGGLLGGTMAEWFGATPAHAAQVVRVSRAVHARTASAAEATASNSSASAICKRFCSLLPASDQAQCMTACMQCGGQTCQLCGNPGSLACCAAGSHCCAGTCCPATSHCCPGTCGTQGACVDLDSDPANCGRCGHACPHGTCQNGTCVSCPAGNTVCIDACVDTSTDVNNCGSCGHACSLPNAVVVCMSGTCVLASCTAGYGNCDGNAANGCETNLLTDANNCGACGNVCPSGETCSGGTCTCGGSACAAGYTCCGGTCVNLTNNASNCGSCGFTCSGGQTCINGACVAACTPNGGPCSLSNPGVCCSKACTQIEGGNAYCCEFGSSCGSYCCPS